MYYNTNLYPFVVMANMCLVVLMLTPTATNGAPAPSSMSVFALLDGDNLLARMTQLLSALGAAGETDERYAPKKSEQSALGGSSADLCLQPVRKGHCRGLIRRWWYDSSANECREFKFGGCDGNSNNFESHQLCEKACRSQDV